MFRRSFPAICRFAKNSQSHIVRRLYTENPIFAGARTVRTYTEEQISNMDVHLKKAALYHNKYYKSELNSVLISINNINIEKLRSQFCIPSDYYMLKDMNSYAQHQLLKLLGDEHIKKTLEVALDLKDILDIMHSDNRLHLFKMLGEERLREIIYDRHVLLNVLEEIDSDNQLHVFKMLDSEHLKEILDSGYRLKILEHLNFENQISLLDILGKEHLNKIIQNDPAPDVTLKYLENHSLMEKVSSKETLRDFFKDSLEKKVAVLSANQKTIRCKPGF